MCLSIGLARTTGKVSSYSGQSERRDREVVLESLKGEGEVRTGRPSGY